MRHRYLTFSVAASLLVLGSCQLTLVAFSVPANVLVDQVFEVLVEGTSDSMPGRGGCVVQLPLGFTVVGESATFSGLMTVGDPALLAMYVAEPGHFLSAWSITNAPSIGSAWLKVFVRAPAVPTTGTIKVALAAQPTGTSPYVANSPVGVTNFAQITAPANVRSTTVVTLPTTVFAPDAIGLPFGVAISNWAGIAVGDLDGDGDDDLVASGAGAQLRAWFRTGATWTESSTGLYGAQSTRVAIGDFDGDGHADIAHGWGVVFFGNGAGTWTPGPTLPQFTSRHVATGDVNGDGRSDVAFGSWYQDHIDVFLGNANRTFTQASTGLPSQNGLGSVDLMLRDVTGDGFVDLVWHQVWAGDGQGNWTMGSGLVNHFPWGLASGDLDGDGQPEIVGAYNSSSTFAGTAVYMHTGANQWAVVPNTGLPTTAQMSVALLDFDRDGRLDIVLGGNSSAPTNLAVWRNLGGMSFALTPSSGLPGNMTSAVEDLEVGDFNGDTFPDLAASIGNSGLVAYQNWLGGLSPFGTGCASGLPQPPALSGIGLPALGNASFAVQVAGGSPGTLGLCWFGLSRYVWGGVTPLPVELTSLGAPGCMLWTGGESATWALFDNAGRFQRPLPIPLDPSFLRFTLFAQGAAYAPGNPLQMAFTPGLAIRIL